MHALRQSVSLSTARRLLLASTSRRGGLETAAEVSWVPANRFDALPGRPAPEAHVPQPTPLPCSLHPACSSRPLRRFQCTAVAQPPVRMGGGGAAKRGGGTKRGGGSGPERSGSDAASSSSQQSSQTAAHAAQLQQERPHAPPPQADEQQASSPAPPPPQHGASEAAQLLPIAFADGRVTVGDGTLLLDRVTPLARVQHPAGTDMVLLSMQAAKGASSIEDFPLGRVSAAAVVYCAVLSGWAVQ